MLGLNLLSFLLESLLDLFEFFIGLALDLLLEHLMRFKLFFAQLVQVLLALGLELGQIMLM